MTKRPTKQRASKKVAKPRHRSLPGEIDTAIIGLLQDDGRMAYSEIAKKLGMSEGTVRNRVMNLINNKFVSISAQALPDAFGFEVLGLVYLNVAPTADITTVAKRFSGLEETYYVAHTSGRYDIVMATFHASLEELEKFLQAHCYGQADLTHIETGIKLKLHKVRTKWKNLTIGLGPI